MGKKRRWRGRPKRCVQRFDALLRTGQHDGAPFALQNFLEKLSQRLFQRAALQLVETDRRQSYFPS